jgi:hypothetical protein
VRIIFIIFSLQMKSAQIPSQAGGLVGRQADLLAQATGKLAFPNGLADQLLTRW